MKSGLQEHIAQEHRLSNSSQYIGEVVYGGIDGIVTTFAVVAGFVGAGATETLGQIGPFAVVLFGLANLFGDGVSMALGKYLSTKSEQDIYQRAWQKEHYEITHNTQMEYDESIEILVHQGMKESDAGQIINVMKQYPDLRVKWMMDNELGMSDVRDDKPVICLLYTSSCQDHDIIFEAYCPLAHGKLWGNEEIMIQLKKIAYKHEMTVAQVMLARLRQQGVTILPKSTQYEHLIDNMTAKHLMLDEEDNKVIGGFPKNFRYCNPAQIAPQRD